MLSAEPSAPPSKRQRTTAPDVGTTRLIGPKPIPDTVTIVSLLARACAGNNPRDLAFAIASLLGYDLESCPPTKGAAQFISSASKFITEAANEGALARIAVFEEMHQESHFFSGRQLNVDSILEVSSFLNPTEKMMLGGLNRSWKRLLSSPHVWQVLDPFPVAAFSSHAEFKAFLNVHRDRFAGVRSLQMPRIPASNKLFHDVFSAMPLVSSLSLQNIVGSGCLRQCIQYVPNPASLMQLSLGLSTRATATEIATALRHFGKWSSDERKICFFNSWG
jgi:hypothetical protein